MNSVVAILISILFILNISLWIKLKTLTSSLEKTNENSSDSMVAKNEEEDEPELASLMGELQRQTHKAGLAIENQNEELSKFYLHEVREMMEVIQAKVPHHDGLEISNLIKTILEPSADQLAEAIEKRDWEASRTKFLNLTNSCNQCHIVTKHEYIKISSDFKNPYLQEFAK